MNSNEQLRELPSVDEVLQRVDARCPRDLLVAETRRVIEGMRDRVKRGEKVDFGSASAEVLASLESLHRPSLRRVINATGVVLHTNLGRAPLGALEGLAEGYCNLEYDLASGKRGRRDVHAASLLERLTGRPGIVVNNNAAAVFLTLHELAGGFEVIVSRGELIEIGDGFRIPDIMARSGAVLREVGTTNRTRMEDYRDAVTERTRLIMRVHPSNFHMSGFTGRPGLAELSSFARERGIPLYEDLGSGCLVDLSPYGIQEPVVKDSLDAGAHLVSFSGDKLLGGPQAGIVAGDAGLVARLRGNPMFRALRANKMVYEALEAVLRRTLMRQYEQVPALAMIMQPASAIKERAERLASTLKGAEIIEGRSVIGGGSTPDQALPTWLIAIATDSVSALDRKLRAGDPAVVARIEANRLLLDLRTVRAGEESDLVSALVQARSR